MWTDFNREPGGVLSDSASHTLTPIYVALSQRCQDGCNIRKQLTALEMLQGSSLRPQCIFAYYKNRAANSGMV